MVRYSCALPSLGWTLLTEQKESHQFHSHQTFKSFWLHCLNVHNCYADFLYEHRTRFSAEHSCWHYMEDVKVGLKIISKEKQRHMTKDKNTVLCFQSLLSIALNLIIYKIDKMHISGKQCFCAFRITVIIRSVSADIREGLAFYQDENKKLMSMFLMFMFLNYEL